MSPRHAEDRGATLVLVAASLLFIFGIAAIVVDGGLGWSERRQAQSAADFAALAALSFATSCESGAPGCDIQDAVDAGASEAIEVANGNLPGRYTATDWASCSDPGRPAEFTRVASASISGCVSFTSNLDKSRIVLPDDQFETSFGRVIGVDSLTVSAFAEAGQGMELSAVIIPFSPTAQTGAEACILSNQTPQTIDPCAGAASSFSGFLDVALFGNDDTGTPSTCNQGATGQRVAINLAKGSDHIMTTYDTGPATNDHAACPNRSEDVDQLEVRETAGNVGNSLTPGLIDGVSGNINGQPYTSTSGRIQCHSASTQCQTVRGEELDHTGLWEYLTSGTCPGTDTHAEMATCLQSWTGGVIFDESISSNRRFVAVPIFTAQPTGPGAYNIARFEAVWLETIYTNCTANECATVHSPGEAGPSTDCPDPIVVGTTNCGWSETGNYNVEGLTAFVIDLDMLPTSIRDFFPGLGQNRTTALTR